jgi:serine/threonine protein kinase
MTLPHGARLGPYEIGELIGRGGMGEVYRASDARLGRDVAIMVLSSQGIDATWFSEEAALLAYDLGQPARSFRPDPPYPNCLRFIAIWELRRPRRAE